MSVTHRAALRGSSGNAGGFSPTSLAGLKHWFKADALTPQSDGSAAPATINDLSSNNATLTKVGTVLYNTNKTPVGGPALRFQRSVQGAYTLPNGFATGFTGCSIYGVMEWVDPADQSEGPWFWGGSAGTQSFMMFGGQVYSYAHGEGRVSFTPSFSLSSKFFVFSVICGANFENYLNNVQGLAPNAATFSAYTGTPAMMGDAGGAGTNRWSGYFAEALVYNSAHNSSDRTSVYNYLKNRHGLT